MEYNKQVISWTSCSRGLRILGTPVTLAEAFRNLYLMASVNVLACNIQF